MVDKRALDVPLETTKEASGKNVLTSEKCLWKQSRVENNASVEFACSW